MQKGHILIIDDDEDEYMIFLIALQDLHVSNRCCYTRSIEQGIKLFQYILPDFIFLDMNMPGLNGLQCLEELKKLKALKTTFVFLYSSYIDDEIKKKALSQGAEACIRKPKSITELTGILKTILGEKADLKATNSRWEISNGKQRLSQRRSLQ